MNSHGKSTADQSYREAWGRYYLPLLRFCLVQLNGDGQAAEDCVQEAFLEYWKALCQDRPIRDLQAWLYKTAASKVSDCRKNEQSRPLSLEDGEPVEETDLLDVILLDAFTDEELTRRVLDRLSRKDRRLFDRICLPGHPAGELAAETGLSPNALYQARWRLRQKVKAAAAQVLEEAAADLTKKKTEK